MLQMIGSTVSSLGATKPAPPKASTVRRNLQMNLVYQVKLDVWLVRRKYGPKIANCILDACENKSAIQTQ